MKTLAVRLALVAAFAATILVCAAGLLRRAYAEKGVQYLYGIAVVEDYGLADMDPEIRVHQADHWRNASIDMIAGISSALIVVAAISVVSLLANLVQAERARRTSNETKSANKPQHPTA